MSDIDLSVPKKAYFDFFGEEMTQNQEQMLLKLIIVQKAKPDDYVIITDIIYSGFLKALRDIPETFSPLFDQLEQLKVNFTSGIDQKYTDILSRYKTDIVHINNEIEKATKIKMIKEAQLLIEETKANTLKVIRDEVKVIREEANKVIKHMENESKRFVILHVPLMTKKIAIYLTLSGIVMFILGLLVIPALEMVHLRPQIHLEISK